MSKLVWVQAKTDEDLKLWAHYWFAGRNRWMIRKHIAGEFVLFFDQARVGSDDGYKSLKNAQVAAGMIKDKLYRAAKARKRQERKLRK